MNSVYLFGLSPTVLSLSKMSVANLPKGKAKEPKEKALQPEINEIKSIKDISNLSLTIPKKSKVAITFDVNCIENPEPSSQSSSMYMDILSEPAPGLSHRDKLMWLQKRRRTGLWVLCDDCERWRYLPSILDKHELPDKWYCHMNPDKTIASCSEPETPLRVRHEEDLIHSEYSVGSVVWARHVGWPWWPAMVDDCPDVEQFYWLDGFSDIPTHYNVVFFDLKNITRSWLSPANMMPYFANKYKMKNLTKSAALISRLSFAIGQADDAMQLSLPDRLEKYCFLNRYNGNICTPKKINKEKLRHYNTILSKKFDVDWSMESSDDSGEEEFNTLTQNINNDKSDETSTKQDKVDILKDCINEDNDMCLESEPLVHIMETSIAAERGSNVEQIETSLRSSATSTNNLETTDGNLSMPITQIIDTESTFHISTAVSSPESVDFEF